MLTSKLIKLSYLFSLSYICPYVPMSLTVVAP
jgi:hypothetical protein